MNDDARNESRKAYTSPVELAENHVDWFLELIRPLLISHFVHGYKHGQEEANNGLYRRRQP
jgi:hypothetical protein